jgi:hypothetical protein
MYISVYTYEPGEGQADSIENSEGEADFLQNERKKLL